MLTLNEKVLPQTVAAVASKWNGEKEKTFVAERSRKAYLPFCIAVLTDLGNHMTVINNTSVPHDKAIFYGAGNQQFGKNWKWANFQEWPADYATASVPDCWDWKSVFESVEGEDGSRLVGLEIGLRNCGRRGWGRF